MTSKSTTTINFTARASKVLMLRPISGAKRMEVPLLNLTIIKSTLISINNKIIIKKRMCTKKTMISFKKRIKNTQMIHSSISIKRKINMKSKKKASIDKFIIKKNITKMRESRIKTTHILRSGRIRSLNIRRSSTMTRNMVIWIRKLRLLKY